MDRRDVLVGLGSVAVGGVAGCISGGGGGSSGPSSGTDAVTAYWNATEEGDAERLNELMHEKHPLHPVEDPAESNVPESVEVSDIETRSAQTVYSDESGSDLYEEELEDADAFEATIEALVDEIGASDYTIVSHTVLIRRPGDQGPGYREPNTITVKSDGQWLVLVNADQLPDITSPA